MLIFFHHASMRLMSNYTFSCMQGHEKWRRLWLCLSIFYYPITLQTLILSFHPSTMILSIEKVTLSWRFFYKLHVLWDVDSYWKSCHAKKQTTNTVILRIKQSICWCGTWNIHVYEFILVLLGNLTEFKNKRFSLTLCIVMNGYIYIFDL